MDLPKEEWNLVDLSRELHLGPFEAKKLEVSLKIFEGGGYKIKTKPAPELKTRKPRTEAHIETGKKDSIEGEDDEALGEPAAEGRKTSPKGPTKPAESIPAKCESHHAPGLEQHACGAWLCRACLEAGGTCAACHAPLTTAGDREARKKERQEDFGRL
jgi:hypothetical protein